MLWLIFKMNSLTFTQCHVKIENAHFFHYYFFLDKAKVHDLLFWSCRKKLIAIEIDDIKDKINNFNDLKYWLGYHSS